MQGRKNVNMTFKDLVSWVARKQEFNQRNCIFSKRLFCWNIFNENKEKLVTDNAVRV